MKQKSLKKVAFLVIGTLSMSLHAQTDKQIKEQYLNDSGAPTLILFKENSGYQNKDYSNILSKHLKLEKGQTFDKINEEKDKLGFTHERFQQYHQGIKVEFATYSIHSKNGNVTSMSGEFQRINNVKLQPSISSNVALERAKAFVEAKTFLWENKEEARQMGYTKPVGELVLLPVYEEAGKVSEVKLAYKFDIYATSPVSRGDVYVDAQSGNILFYNATIKHLGEYSHGKGLKSEQSGFTMFKPNSFFMAANAATRYSGTQSIETSLSGSSYILSEATRGTGNGVLTLNMKKGTNYSTAVNFTDADNNWTAAEFNNANKDNAALDAHWGAEKTYDYWFNVHGRNSYNNSGTLLKSYVHYSSNYDNAYWNGSVMTYGDGGTYFDALTSIDVAGHEIGHAVCSSTSNLAYQLESGAMNEGFSDIWGACVEYYAAPTKQRWLIGEDIERRAGHLALRSMSEPKSEGQPDTYGGTNWVSQVRCRPSNRNDYCGVHTNSGVLNHWFYILTEGKSGTNDLGNSYNVTGIGIDKAAKIAFRLESVYLSANSNYANARTFGIQAATDLYGAGSPEVIATTNAWYAVGLGSAFVALNKMAKTSNEITTDKAISVYPNPFENEITISLTNLDNTTYSISNLLGQKVMSGTLNNTTISLGNLTRGMYILEVTKNDTVIVSQKLMKN